MLDGPTDIVIVGGGIGGLVAALALSAQGAHIQVLEKARAFGEIGAGIQIGPNAARVFDELGILEEIRADAFFPKRLVLMDALTGEEITSLDTGESFERAFGYRYFVTHRADLHAALLKACLAKPAISLVSSAEVVDVEQRDDRVEVVCADETVFEADLLIGADGLWSTVRRVAFGYEDPPNDSGYVAYRGTVPMADAVSEESASLAEDMVIWAGPHLHLVQYPVRRGTLRNQVATIDTQVYGEHSENLTEQLHHAFAGMFGPVRDGVALMETSKRWTLVDRDPVPKWVNGRIALLGDAAHPMLQYLAQGACQAAEDAMVLAESVGAHPYALDEALREYAAERIPRTARVQKNARKFGEVLHVDGMGATLRNLLLSQKDPEDFDPVDWIYATGAERPLTNGTHQLKVRS